MAIGNMLIRSLLLSITFTRFWDKEIVFTNRRRYNLTLNLIWFVSPPALDRGAAVEVFQGDEGERHSLLAELCDIVITVLSLPYCYCVTNKMREGKEI